MQRSESRRMVPSANVRSVNVSRIRTIDWHGRRMRTALFKEPVLGPVEVRGNLVAGDAQAEKRHHGGPTMAVYAYAREDYRWWEDALGSALADATFGENLTTEGIDINAARIGSRWRVGSAVLEVTAPRIPCSKLAARMQDPGFVKRFAAANRTGAYLRIERAGTIEAGDAIDVLSEPRDAPTIAEAALAHWAQKTR